MIVFEGVGNLFTLTGNQREIQTLTNTVNTAGVMGKGIALAFKQRYPSLLERYREALKSGELTLDRPWLSGPYKDGKKVLCFATKEHWINDSKPEYIARGLRFLTQHWEAMGITSLAMPALGCGNGGLNYGEVVRPLIHHFLGPIDLPVSIFLSPDQLDTIREG